LKSLSVSSNKLNDDADRALVADLFRQLSLALEVKTISICISDLVVPGSLLRDIGERCTKLKALTLKEFIDIDGPFDSPTAFLALETLHLDLQPLISKKKKQKQTEAVKERDAIEPPDFSHFLRLGCVSNVILNAKWALSLAHAPCLKSIDECNAWSKLHLTKEELRAFLLKASQGPMRTSLTSITLSDFMSDKSPIDDVTAIALLDTFPMLTRLDIDIPFSWSDSFLNKLKQAEHVKNLTLKCDDQFRPTRAWLADSCHRFPKTLEYLHLTMYGYCPDANDFLQGQEEDGEDYIEFIKDSFHTCLRKLEYVGIDR